MGLLDDAIREHLELKRRAGADPSEIARVQHEALEPIFPDEHLDASDGAVDLSMQDTPEMELEEPLVEEPPVDDEAAPPDEGAGFASVGQETAELDMQAVLDADRDHPSDQPGQSPAGTRPVRASPAGQIPEQDSMEWEVPGSGESRAAPEEVPGQERLSFE